MKIHGEIRKNDVKMWKNMENDGKHMRESTEKDGHGGG